MSDTIEKNKISNVNLLQMEYFSDIDLSKKEAVVIEPNNSIAITIRKFLAELGFEDIHICKEIKEGIEIFLHFIALDVNVPIIIDSGSNKNIKNNIKKILEMQPNAKIIITTVKEKTDPQILQLYNVGISSILQKPLMFDDFKKIFSDENATNDVESKIEGIESKIEEDKLSKNLKEILLSHNKITSNKFQDTYKIEQSMMEQIITDAIQNGEISLEGEILEAGCNQCNSTNITSSSECPKCNGINFEQKNIIEHYSCGEIYPKKTDYERCPKCNKQIGSVGKDYREFSDYHICSRCNEKFPNPLRKFVCFDCGNNFLDKLALWKRGKIYKIQI